MTLWEKIARSNFFIKLKSWEYWPFGIVQFPAVIYWFWLSLRARSFVFFSASNPGIPMGGMFGESKFLILQNIPERYRPRTRRIPFSASVGAVEACIADAGLQFPLIFKPDVGERGFQVRKIKHAQDIAGYLEVIRGDFLVQEFVELPFEFGVFFLRYPGDEKGKVISVTAKEMLFVTGDGKSTLRELILRNDRAKLQWKRLRTTYDKWLQRTIPAGERIELGSIGNHCLGTRFINAGHLINDRMSEAFSEISRNIPGFYFGRFDLRCSAVEDLYSGSVKILELNGCGAEPTHIYDVQFSLWEAMKAQVIYWDHIFKIARDNRKRGVPYISHKEAFSYYREFKSKVK